MMHCSRDSIRELFSVQTDFVVFELIMLTCNVAVSPLVKSTPPHSPRASLNDGTDITNKARTGIPSNSAEGSRDDREVASTTNIASVPSTSAPVNPARGKLKVRIPEARGIRPSDYPYAVCVFEWNESIARGTTVEDGEKEGIGNRRQDHVLAGISTKPIRCEMGRSMAIPVKSRQGSTTSLTDFKNSKTGGQLTEPKWDHEAELSAQLTRPIYVSN